MPAPYYVSLKSGSVVLIANVTATPTLVLNDGTAASVSSGTYRDLISAYGVSLITPGTSVPIWGPGFTSSPNFALTTGGTLTFQTTGVGSPGPFNLYKDDRLTGTAPRQMSWDESHWRFVTAGGDYFIPFKEVIAMSNSEPLY